MIHHAPDARVLPQRLGCGQPDRQGGKLDKGRHPLDRRVGVGDQALGGPDAAAGANEVPIHHLIVTTDRKVLASALDAKAGHQPQNQVGPVETDEIQRQQFCIVWGRPTRSR